MTQNIFCCLELAFLCQSPAPKSPSVVASEGHFIEERITLSKILNPLTTCLSGLECENRLISQDVMVHYLTHTHLYNSWSSKLNTLQQSPTLRCEQGCLLPVPKKLPRIVPYESCAGFVSLFFIDHDAAFSVACL